MKTTLTIVKCLTIIAFMVTLSTTYYLRSEVLTLSTIRFSADDRRADEELRERKESYPLRVAEYEAQVKQYDIEMAHYQKMLDLYQNNVDEYIKLVKDKYRPPSLPHKPGKPTSPELSDEFAKINAQFRSQQYHYYESTSRLNWVCGASALLLVGGLLFLIMFETGSQRFLYLVVLIVSFVFMIGPSFHSIISAIVGFLEAPRVY